jgi:activator of 2-hydroxyglutaryl-CoA dehydratase
MQMNTAILGIDVAKETLDVALMQVEKLITKQFANTTSGHQ